MLLPVTQIGCPSFCIDDIALFYSFRFSLCFAQLNSSVLPGCPISYGQLCLLSCLHHSFQWLPISTVIPFLYSKCYQGGGKERKDLKKKKKMSGGERDCCGKNKSLKENQNECFTCCLLAQLPYLRKYAGNS